MKKYIVILAVLAILINYKNSTIPKESIRFRVIANSNNEEDQQIKMNVKNNLQTYLNTIISNQNTIEDTREQIKNNLSTIKEIVFDMLKTNNFEVNYGQNYFPEKKYLGETYKEGNYESLVVTLGKGEGKNWWCVLYPSFCLMDIDDETSEEVKYDLFINKIINNIIK